jgi:hypothetical protein
VPCVIYKFVEMDHFKACRVLEVDPSCATSDEIKRSYKKLLLKHHPDKGGDTETFIEIQEAFEYLTRYNSNNVNINIAFDDIFRIFLQKMKIRAEKYKGQGQGQGQGLGRWDEDGVFLIPPIKLSVSCTIFEMKRQSLKKIKYIWMDHDRTMLCKNTEVIIVPIMNYTEPFIIEKMGDLRGGVRGDVIITFEIVPHDLYQIIQLENCGNSRESMYDIWVIQKYPINDFLLGRKICLGDFGLDDVIHIAWKSPMMRIFGEGIPYTDANGDVVYGDLCICGELDKGSICGRLLEDPGVKDMINRITVINLGVHEGE